MEGNLYSALIFFFKEVEKSVGYSGLYLYSQTQEAEVGESWIVSLRPHDETLS
jgi:hypothetical protein